MHIHQPLKSTSMRRCSSFDSRSGYFGEVVVVLDVRCRGPHEDAAVDHLAHHMQVAAFLQVEHLAADQHRRLREPRHRERAQDRVGLDLDVVVHEQDVLALRGLECLVHDAAVSAGAAEVALIVNGEPITERCGSLGEPGLVAHLAGALVRHDHGLDHVGHQRIRGQCSERLDRVGRAVERRNTNGDSRFAGRLDGRVPAAALDDDGRIGGDVEPDPATVLERRQFDLELDRGIAVGKFLAFHVNSRGVGLGAVDVDAAVSGQFESQDHRFQDGPAAPVAGGERVEVGGERDLGLGAERDRRARGGVSPTTVGLSFLQVQRADVERFTGAGQDDPLRAATCRGRSPRRR